MWFSDKENSEIKSLLKSVDDLNLLIVKQKLQLEKLQLEKASGLKLPELEVYQPCAFDFSKVNAFSIERKVNKTCIGYINDNEALEWYINCDLENHERLVKEFKEFSTK